MYKSWLAGKDPIAEATMLFRFAKPEGFQYRAGQSIDLFLVEPPETDEEGDKRAYSLASAPHEKELLIATRMRNTAFKRVLGGAPEGLPVLIDGPFGEMTLHEDPSRPAVFLAGGIGITPFRAILLDAIERRLPHAMTLFYSNRRPADAAFFEEFQTLAGAHKAFTFVPTMTEAGDRARWEGERGYIDAAMIQKYATPGANPVYYLAGPPAMATAMRRLLSGMGVAEEDTRFELFTGY